MPNLISFTSSIFNVTNETPNPVNPIFGEGVLNWLGEVLSSEGYTYTKPDYEDWGWYIDVSNDQASYMVGASGEYDGRPSRLYWVIQVHKDRRLIEKLLGKNKLASDDPLFSLIERTVRDLDGLQDLQVERDA